MGTAERIYIKNMVCNRCILAVERELELMELSDFKVLLGEVHLPSALSESQQSHLRMRLENLGFEILDERKAQLIEQIKQTVRAMVYREPGAPAVNLSQLITEKIPHDYSYLSSLFSHTEGITIEKYTIGVKIERVKELLVYGELSLSEIALTMDYSSVAYLSNQFKKITGLSPSHFKAIGKIKRTPLDKI